MQNNTNITERFSELVTDAENSLKVHDTTFQETTDFIVMQKVENFLKNLSVNDAFSLVKEIGRNNPISQHDILYNMALTIDNVKHFVAETVHSNLQ